MTAVAVNSGAGLLTRTAMVIELGLGHRAGDRGTEF